METLESIFLVQRVKGWCTVNDLYRDLEDLAASPFESGRRGVSMRMLRYRRDGLLIRIKTRGRLTEYKLSERGENRLMYFWRKFGLLTPPPEWQRMGEKGRIAKELADLRMSLFKEITQKQIERLLNDRPLRTPKIRTVLKFGSTPRRNAPQMRARLLPG
jgi:hypothetical protein